MAEVAPVSVSEPQPGVYVVDFGINLSGFCRIQVQGNDDLCMCGCHALAMRSGLVRRCWYNFHNAAR